ncbi:hypothetical protein SNC40_08615, partial [Escherichia coli]|nr:hypothetical protein [Escherichia coli]
MMKFKKCLLPVAMLASFTLAGCQSNADDHAADVYQTDQLNTKQETKTVKEGANKRGNSSRLTQSFHFFMFEPIFSP